MSFGEVAYLQHPLPFGGCPFDSHGKLPAAVIVFHNLAPLMKVFVQTDGT